MLKTEVKNDMMGYGRWETGDAVSMKSERVIISEKRKGISRQVKGYRI